MDRVAIEDLRENDLVEGAYLLSQKQLGTARTGKPYLKLRFQDRTGEIEGRVWDNAENLSQRIETGQVVRVRGTVESYNGKLQLRVDELRRVPTVDADPADFLPVTQYDIPDMWKRLLAIVEEMKNPHIRGLLQDILNEREFSSLFQRAPAAKGIHHPWIGGLLEHVLSLAHLAKRVCPHYPQVDEEQVIFGCLMHDMGKVWELTYGTAISYSDEGRLIGHLVMGVVKVGEAIARRKDFPPELALRLKHILVAHHGQYEFGSPKLPQTLEAELTHRLDDLDSKMNAITQQLGKQAGGDPHWSEYAGALGRAFYRGPEEPRGAPDKLVELPEETPDRGDARAAVPAKPPASKEGVQSLDLFARTRSKGSA